MSAQPLYTHISRVRFTHTDPGGYVFFPRFFEKFQAAIEDWFNLGLGVDYADLILKRGLGLPTAHTECTFSKPCLLGEMLHIIVRLEKLGTTSLTVEFIGMVAGEERLRARSVLVLIDLKDGRPVPIPPDIREKLESTEGEK
jgi:4-hydroxybenzoyl-CoA thioesterase